MIYDSKSHKNHQQVTHPELNVELKQSCHTCHIPVPGYFFQWSFPPKEDSIGLALCFSLNLLLATLRLSPCPTSILSQKSGIESYPRTRHVLPPRFFPHPSKPNTPRPARLSRIPSRWPGIYHLRLSTPQREKGKEGGFSPDVFWGSQKVDPKALREYLRFDMGILQVCLFLRGILEGILRDW